MRCAFNERGWNYLELGFHLAGLSHLATFRPVIDLVNPSQLHKVLHHLAEHGLAVLLVHVMVYIVLLYFLGKKQH